MNKKLAISEKIVCILATIFLFISAVAAYFLNGDPKSIIPYSGIVLIIVHSICALLSFFCIFKPVFQIEFTILQVESIFTILTGRATLGIFFFYGSLFLLFCKRTPEKSTKPKITCALIFHFFVLLGTFTHGWIHTILCFISSCFYGAFFVWIYYILKTRFSIFTPTKVIENSNIREKQPGATLNLSNFNLTERQKDFILANLRDNLSYNEISDKFYVSISLVKKEFRSIFKTFGVSNKEELRLLLLQYDIRRS